jgi:hypothetical protein
MDVVAERGLRRILPGERHDEGRLHQLALAGDVVSNSLYYAAIAAPTVGGTWARAAVLGAAAGLGALLLPERMGLGTPPHSDRPANRIMTVAWYAAGAAAAATVATLLRSDRASNARAFRPEAATARAADTTPRFADVP